VKRHFGGSVVAALVAAAAPAAAHTGPRVWVGNVDGTLVTLGSDNDTAPTSYSPQRLFIGGIDEDTLLPNGRLDSFPVPGTGIFATEFPGYQVRLDRPNDSAGGGLSFGTTVGFKVAGPLLVFDASRGVYQTTQQAYGDPGPAPQLGLSLPGGSGQTVVTGAGTLDGFNFFSYNSASDHAHLLATLLPDGVVPPPGQAPGDGPHAVYALPLRLSASGYTDSRPFVILYGRGIGYPEDSAFTSALSVAQSSYGFPGDANLDGVVDVADLGILASHWQLTGFWTDGDFDNSGLIDVADLGILASNWQHGSDESSAGASLQAALEGVGMADLAIPEPSCWLGSILIGMVRLRRSRRHQPESGIHEISRPRQEFDS
jgi:hypothetical protein